VGFHPGSTLGNLEPEEASAFLRHIARTTGDDGGLLIGLDLVKDAAILQAAYDDAAGVTAAFNLNLLRRLNRELGADFRLDRFRHRARWHAGALRMEMHLESVCAQRAVVAGAAFDFAAGETIHTENSHKYRLADIAALAAAAGLRSERIWQDDQGWFAVCYLVPDRRQPETASASPHETGAAR
jgi:dimethylhistidine N-methyltransferase